jgi:hypothetical protein
MEARSTSGSNCTGVDVGSIQGPAVGVEFAVAQAEGVAGEPAARGGVPDAVVVAGVAGRVGKQQFAAGQVHGMPSCVVCTRSAGTGSTWP